MLFIVLALPGLSIGTTRAATSSMVQSSIITSSLSETQSAAIIVAGDRSDHEFQTQIMSGADQVYNILVNNRGFLPSRVYYLGSLMGGAHPNVDAISTWSNIQSAFTTWLSANTDASHGIVVYLFDHGGTGGMAIPGGTLYASDVNGWLNSAVTSRIIIVYEACESGSFIGYLSKSNRIIVTSTDAAHSAWPSSSWAYFSESFWGSIATGETIGDSFVAGWYNVEKNGHVSDQIPLVDDNHDYVGHTPQVVMVWMLPVAFLPNGGDGNDALNTLITGYGGTLYKPIVYLHIPIYVISKYADNAIPISVQVLNNTRIKNVLVRAVPPGWVSTPPLPPDNETSGQHLGRNAGLFELNLTENQPGSGVYTGNLTGAAGPLPRGDFNISIYAITDAGVSDQAFTRATINDNGVPPSDVNAPTIAITAPQNGMNISGSFNITAIGDDDQGLNRIELFVDGALAKNVSMPAYKPYPVASHLLNTALLANGNHTIRAKAIDNAGLSSTTDVVINVQNTSISGFLPVVMIGILIAGIAWIIGRRRVSTTESNS
nr:C13 family peptidase [Candidatus Sigynarchaeota archaeon]